MVFVLLCLASSAHYRVFPGSAMLQHGVRKNLLLCGGTRITVRIYHVLSTCLSVSGHLGCFPRMLL